MEVIQENRNKANANKLWLLKTITIGESFAELNFCIFIPSVTKIRP